jgi:hypothetical protein
VRHVVRGKTRDAEAAIEQHLRSVPDGPHQIEYRDAPCLQYIEPSWDADLIGR